jgi:hypothetical protein
MTVIAEFIDEIIDNGIVQFFSFFNFIECWNDSQSSGIVPLVVYNQLAFNEVLNLLNSNVHIYNREYRVTLPQNAVINPDPVRDLERYNPINVRDPLATDFNLENKSRLKSKYLYIRLIYNNLPDNIPLVVQDWFLQPRPRNFKFLLNSLEVTFRQNQR